MHAPIETISGGGLASQPQPVTRPVYALDSVNFFAAAAISGIGFVPLYLADKAWTPQEIGYALSAAAAANLLAQIPAGAILDRFSCKRAFIGIGFLAVSIASIVFALYPTFASVTAALILVGITTGILLPGIIAISIRTVGRSGHAQRLGRNLMFEAAGNLTAAALLGIIGQFGIPSAMFLFSAALTVPGLISLAMIRSADKDRNDHIELTSDRQPTDKSALLGRRDSAGIYALLIFAGCMFLFQAANASIIPLTGQLLSYRGEKWAPAILSALIIVPQVLVVLLATSKGKLADSWGRKPLLLIGLGVVPLKSLLFIAAVSPWWLVVFQMLDGLTATIVGILAALIVADVSYDTNRFNLFCGFIGTVARLGGAFSTTFTGLIAGEYGYKPAFLIITALASGAVVLALFMPETKPYTDLQLPETAPPLRFRWWSPAYWMVGEQDAIP